MDTEQAKKRVQPRLKRIALAQGVSPEEVLRDALEQTATLSEAAEKLGVTNRTLAQWRSRVGVGA